MDSTTSPIAGPTDTPLLKMTIGCGLEATVDRCGDREALAEVATGRRWTYQQLADDVNAVAKAMLDSGIQVGDRIGIWAVNCAAWAIVQYATAKIGAILVPLNPGYRAREAEYVLNQAGVRLLFASTAFKSSDYRAMVAEMGPRCSRLRQVVYFDDGSWTELLASGRSLPGGWLEEVTARLSPHDPINIQYTSGTTGVPKGVTLSHHNILNNGFFLGERLGYTQADRICVPVPFYHCMGMVLGTLAAGIHGACVVIPAPSFDPEATLRACADERCTSLYGVPTMFIAMLNTPRADAFNLSALRTGLMAGSMCPIEVMKKVVHWAPEIAIAYGMTETSPAATQTSPGDPIERRVSTVGRAHPHVEMKVIYPATGRIVPRKVPGELCVRGYLVMLGYWNQPDETAETIDIDGWIHTGDLATIDDDGFVSITGRIKDLVIRGGENIYPREIEELLHTHPDVLDAYVVGVPDPKLGEELMAWLRLRPGAAAIDAAAVREFCRDHLAHYKIPRYAQCVEQFPLTASGKLRKVELREQAAALLHS